MFSVDEETDISCDCEVADFCYGGFEGWWRGEVVGEVVEGGETGAGESCFGGVSID